MALYRVTTGNSGNTQMNSPDPITRFREIIVGAMTPGPWRPEGAYSVRSSRHEGRHEVCRIDNQWGSNKLPTNNAEGIVTSAALARYIASDECVVEIASITRTYTGGHTLAEKILTHLTTKAMEGLEP